MKNIIKKTIKICRNCVKIGLKSKKSEASTSLIIKIDPNDVFLQGLLIFQNKA